MSGRGDSESVRGHVGKTDVEKVKWFTSGSLPVSQDPQ